MVTTKKSTIKQLFNQFILQIYHLRGINQTIQALLSHRVCIQKPTNEFTLFLSFTALLVRANVGLLVSEFSYLIFLRI